MTKTPHEFHIPVMGTGFTIDTPLYVAPYGISSVVSLVDDVLIEQMRAYYSAKNQIPFTPILQSEPDSRAKRITAYLNLLQTLVNQKVETIRQSVFSKESAITKYFERLPEHSRFKKIYHRMLQTHDLARKEKIAQFLRKQVVAGSIDVNIMTKLDADRYQNHQKLPRAESGAHAALRGYALSNLSSGIVFSAGLNPALYSYTAQFPDFLPASSDGELKKKVILKVSDYRSAEVQGKFLAKRGLWVSEFRVESAVNCGGHAFINEGDLLGPILEDFKQKREALLKTLYEIYAKTIQSLKQFCPKQPATRFTVQGGIGTHAEHDFLMKHYALDATGWGSPFLMVPEATQVDEAHLQQLIDATENDIYLSDSSPLGVPFWNLRTSESEKAREARIQKGCPGAPCVKGYAKFNSELTDEPVCVASRAYQEKRLALLEKETLPAPQKSALLQYIVGKSCICNDLAGGVLKKLGIDLTTTPAICPGPNVFYFKKILSLDEMISHIYGRVSLLTDKMRPHVFMKELRIQIDLLKKDMQKSLLGLATRPKQKMETVKANLLQGIEYYQALAKTVFQEHSDEWTKWLLEFKEELSALSFEALPA